MLDAKSIRAASAATLADQMNTPLSEMYGKVGVGVTVYHQEGDALVTMTYREAEDAPEDEVVVEQFVCQAEQLNCSPDVFVNRPFCKKALDGLRDKQKPKDKNKGT